MLSDTDSFPRKSVLVIVRERKKEDGRGKDTCPMAEWSFPSTPSYFCSPLLLVSYEPCRVNSKYDRFLTQCWKHLMFLAQTANRGAVGLGGGIKGKKVNLQPCSPSLLCAFSDWDIRYQHRYILYSIFVVLFSYMLGYTVLALHLFINFA